MVVHWKLMESFFEENEKAKKKEGRGGDVLTGSHHHPSCSSRLFDPSLAIFVSTPFP